MPEAVHVGSGKVRELYALDDGAPAARRQRPHLGLRRRPADRDPRQGPCADRPLRVLVRAHAATIVPNHLLAHPRRTAARRSAGGSRCCRSSASSAATSSGSGWKDYQRDGRGLRHRAARRASRVGPARRADLHARDEGADRARREHHARAGGGARRRRPVRRGRAHLDRALRIRRRATPPSAGSSSPTRSSSSASTRTGSSFSATRSSRPTPRASGRPTEYEPGGPQPSFDKQFVRDYAESLGWDKTAPGPELPDDVVAGTRARYLEAFEQITGIPFDDYAADPRTVLR